MTTFGKLLLLAGAGGGIYWLWKKSKPVKYEEVVPPPPEKLLAWSKYVTPFDKAVTELEGIGNRRRNLGGDFKKGEVVHPIPAYAGLKPMINAPFAEARGEGTVHPGIDFDYLEKNLVGKFLKPWRSPTNDKSAAFMPPDTPALAIADGEVYSAGLAPPRSYYPHSSSGYTVGVKHANGALTVYCHLINSFVNVGEKVVKGQPLGIVGNDYGVGGNKFLAEKGGIVHLHFQTYFGGKLVNPMTLLKTATVLTEPRDVRGDYANYLESTQRDSRQPSFASNAPTNPSDFLLSGGSFGGIETIDC